LKKSLVMVRRNFLFTMLTFCLLPRITLAKQNNDELRKHFIGSNTAPIKIKEYFSLTCGHCANFHNKTLPEFKKKYIDTGKVQLEFIDYPLDRLAIIAATLARTIPTEKGYVEAIAILLKKQKQWAYSNKPIDELRSISKLFGISSNKFDSIVQNIPLMQKIVNKMEEETKNFNIESTPTFIINNKHKITGALTFKDFEKKLFELTEYKNS
jgi:protein-disulfide isomerase